jgi:hypothetical protein
MNEGTRSGKSTIRLLGISAEKPTNGLYLYLFYHYGIPQDTTFTDGVIVEALLALLTAVPIKVVLALASTFTVT